MTIRVACDCGHTSEVEHDSVSLFPQCPACDKGTMSPIRRQDISYGRCPRCGQRDQLLSFDVCDECTGKAKLAQYLDEMRMGMLSIDGELDQLRAKVLAQNYALAILMKVAREYLTETELRDRLLETEENDDDAS